MKKILMSVAALFMGWSMVSAQDYSAEFKDAQGSKDGSFAVQNFTLEGKAWYATCGYFDKSAKENFRLGRRSKDSEIAAKVESKFTSLGISEQGAVLEMKWDLENIKGFNIVSSYNWDAGNKVTLLVSTDEGATYQIVSTETIAEKDPNADEIVERTFSDETARAKARYALALEGKTEGQCRLNLTKVFTSEEASSRVAQPFFTPAGQTFTDSVKVTLDCATEDAEIFYSLTEADPTTKYTEPIVLKATTTITAIAKKEGMEDSKVATSKYTLAADMNQSSIAAIWETYESQITPSVKNYALCDEVVISGKVVVSNVDEYNTRIWVQDMEQENGRSLLVIFSKDYGFSDIKIGDVVENLTGALNGYYATLQLQPTQKITATEHDATPYVTDVTIPELVAAPLKYQSALIRVEDVTFVETGRFNEKENYKVVNGTDSLTFRTDYSSANYVGSTIPTGAQKITGICATYNSQPQITARNKKDMVSNDTPEPPTANENGAAVKFSAYPNPTSGLLTLDVEDNNYNVRVFTVAGVEVMNLKALNGKTQINLEGMAQGVYVVEIATANGTSRAKVVLR